MVFSMDNIHVKNGESVRDTEQTPNPEMSYAKNWAEVLFHVEDFPREDCR